MPPAPTSASLLVLGDIHNHWRAEDVAFLERHGQDLALFVGDLGDEDVELVRCVAKIRARKAVILGNHDAWESFTRRRPTQRLLDSLAALDTDHLAYKVLEVPRGGISIVGARPFSWGGKSLRSPEIYRRLYQVRDMEASAHKIVEAARAAQHRDIVILAHNGPSGLSKETSDIYGKDFGNDPGGDWGDADLAMAIEQMESRGLRVRCVVAGHMHHRLSTPRGAERARFVRRNGTLFVNPAVVPRLRELAGGGRVAHYLRMVWSGGELQQLEEIWVDEQGQVRQVDEPDVVELQH